MPNKFFDMKFMRLVYLFILVSTVLVIQANSVKAQNENDIRVNFAYAFQLGFGSYDIGGLDVKVFKLPLSYTFDLPQYEKLKIKIDSPLFYGRFRFKGTIPDGTRLTADQDIIAYIPGIELQYEVLDNWYLKPFGNLGIAWSISEKARPANLNIDSSTIYIYTVGLRSLYEIFWERFKFSIGNAILWAGNSTFVDGEPDESYGILENGIEALHPLGFRIKGYEPDMSAFFIYYRYLPDAEFSRFLKSPLKVENQYEIAGTIGSATPLKLWVINNPRIGIGYRFGDLNVFTINFGFPF
ncbi:MAG: hypothetical protein WBB48_01240 [Thermodesulfobacteriota bacterium]